MDRYDGPQESHARLHDITVRMTDGGWQLPSEHHVEFREAEDERFALVDEHDVDGLAEGIRKNGCELEATESCAEHNHAGLHRLCPFRGDLNRAPMSPLVSPLMIKNAERIRA